MKITEVLDSVGFGAFQKRHMAAACVTGSVVSSNLMLMYYVAIPLTMSCTDGFPCSEDEPPSEEMWCSDPSRFTSLGWTMTGPSSLFTTWPSTACDDSWMIPLSQSFFFVGWMAAALATGNTADIYGRKRPLIASLLALSLSCALTGISGFFSTPYLYIASKFVHGAAVGCCLLFVYVFGSELIPSSKGSFFGTTYFMIAALGSAFAAVIAYFCQSNWQMTTFFTALLALPCVMWPAWSPESPVWLASKDVSSAINALKTMAPHGWKAPRSTQLEPDSSSSDSDSDSDSDLIASSEAPTASASNSCERRVPALRAPSRSPASSVLTLESNGLTNSFSAASTVTAQASVNASFELSQLLESNRLATISKQRTRAASISSQESTPRNVQTETSTDDRDHPMRVLISENHLRLTLNLAFCWFGCSLCYFGLGLGGATLPGDFYQNGALLSLVEIPVYWVLDVLMEGDSQTSLVSRKSAMTGSCLIAALSCLSFLVVPVDVAKWISFVGQMFITAAFTVIYIWTSELLHSSLRATGMGVCIASGKLGSIAAPYTVMLAGKSLTSAMCLYGVLAVLSAKAAFDLPHSLAAHEAAIREREVREHRLLTKAKLAESEHQATAADAVLQHSECRRVASPIQQLTRRQPVAVSA